jgi:hypothetical protein
VAEQIFDRPLKVLQLARPHYDALAQAKMAEIANGLLRFDASTHALRLLTAEDLHLTDQDRDFLHGSPSADCASRTAVGAACQALRNGRRRA